MTDTAVVFIPGIMGSELVFQNDLIWPGSLTELVGPYKRMSELTSTSTQERNVIRRVTPFYSVYSPIVDHLSELLPGRVFECPYDWRRANEESAKKLANKINEAGQKHAEVVIVAHSMGGLISRYYLESGDFDSAAGFKQVSTLITLATPHYGSPFALTAALSFDKKLFLSSDQVYELASNPQFPSVYQLLPPPGIPVAWRTDVNLRPENLYASPSRIVGNHGRGLSAANIEAAGRFWSSFRKRANVRYFCFVGTQHRMTNSVNLASSGGQLQASKPEELDCSGDGTVPSWSAVLDHVQSLAVGGDHLGLVGNTDLHDTLDLLLGVTPKKVAAIPPVTISLKESVIETSAPVSAVIQFRTLRPIVKGSIHIEPQAGLSLRNASIVHASIEVAAVKSMALEVLLTAPEVPGFYRVTWSEEDKPLAQKELIVQSPRELSDDQMRQFREMELLLLKNASA